MNGNALEIQPFYRPSRRLASSRAEAARCSICSCLLILMPTQGVVLTARPRRSWTEVCLYLYVLLPGDLLCVSFTTISSLQRTCESQLCIHVEYPPFNAFVRFRN